MITYTKVLVFLFSLFFCFACADTISGPPPRQKILVLKGFESITKLTDALKQRHDVDVMKNLPSDLSGYYQVWDVRFNQGSDASRHSNYLKDNELLQLKSFMRDSGTVFLLGENEGFPGRNYNTIDFVNEVTESGDFATSKFSVLNLNGSSKNSELQKNAAFKAENFGLDFENLETIGNVYTEFPGGVRLSELAGGIAVYNSNAKFIKKEWHSNFSWPTEEVGAIGVAFKGNVLKDEFKHSKLFVFCDWQATGPWGFPESNKAMFNNIVDFLTISRPIPIADLNADPGDTIFNSVSLNVALSSQADSIFYTINSIDTILYTGPISIMGDTTVIWAIAKGDGYVANDSSWIYIRNLPDAYLIADPGKKINVYNTGKMDVTLETEKTDTITWYVKHEDGTTDSGIFVGSGIVTVTGDDTITATADGIAVDPVTKTWIYDQQLPNAFLKATPSNNSIWTYYTQYLDVELNTNSGNHIVYQVISSSSISDWDTTSDSSTVIQITGDVTISAYTIGEDFKSISGKWEYECDLPQLEVKADPTDTSFQMFLDVSLNAIHSDTVVDAIIKYIIDSTGMGYDLSDVKSKGLTYDNSKGLKITNSIILYVCAIDEKGEYADAFNSFAYKMDLKKVSIEATPSKTPFLGIGKELDSIVLSVSDWQNNKDVSLKWLVTEDSVTSFDTFNQKGVLWDSLSYPAITHSDKDTSYLSIMAFGHGYDTVCAVFTYIRQYLPIVSVIPSDSLGFKFSNSVDVELSIPDSTNKYKNLKIHYIYDSLPEWDSLHSTNCTVDNYSDIIINKTGYLKVYASAENAVVSKKKSFYYILSAGVTNAWYKDVNAGGMSDTVDGAIDQAIISLSKNVNTLPDSVLLVCPYDNSEKVTISQKNIRFVSGGDNGLIVTLPEPFQYDTENGSTEIADQKFSKGQIFGKAYTNEVFSLGDSIAPLIQRAIYHYGDCIVNGDSIQCEPDVIEIKYSEKVKIPNILKGEVSPAAFYSISQTSDYTMDLKYKNDVGNTFVFYVKKIVSVAEPQHGDLIRIDYTDNISDTKGNIQAVEQNRFGKLTVIGNRNYPYIVRCVSPVDPRYYAISAVLQKGNIKGVLRGIPLTVDFLKKINTEKMLEAEVVIFDKIGNIISSIDGYGQNNNLALDILNINSTQNKTLIALVWNGRNNNNRLVSSGTYLLKISFMDPNGVKRVESIPVGVRYE